MRTRKTSHPDNIVLIICETNGEGMKKNAACPVQVQGSVRDAIRTGIKQMRALLDLEGLKPRNVRIYTRSGERR